MKALISETYGPVDQLTIAEVPAPQPGPGQVLIRAEAAALNPLDIRLTTGEMREMMPVEHPFVLGLDSAGVVAQVGDDVNGFSPGDEVVAFTYQAAGAIAEYTLANVGPSLVVRPSSLDAVRGAAVPVAAMMAAGMAEAAQIQQDESALIIGATGGVGSFAVQLARQAGARVLATARPDEAEQVRGLGAHDTIDYTTADTAEEAVRLQPGGVDLVLDMVNAAGDLAGSAAAITGGGRLLSSLGGPPEFDRGVSATYCHVQATEGRLQQMVDRVAAGDLRAEVGAIYRFVDAPKAVADFEGKHTRGKVVITF